MFNEQEVQSYMIQSYAGIFYIVLHSALPHTGKRKHLLSFSCSICEVFYIKSENTMFYFPLESTNWPRAERNGTILLLAIFTSFVLSHNLKAKTSTTPSLTENLLRRSGNSNISLQAGS